ncbi:hypothetical protein OE88DRAFT_1733875 [Heliocybe sulcata]|uniref:Uncharacterized protein n=1 Tax=Heliocybe sulcata TaxID=5364 RepID=A0A5C3N7W1_9AGAM|nr:hypothetical protein OE88DRAFT_1733875 [Heliocybe sulcata]
MGLFYAYVKNSKDDATYRYMITFATRETADDWWRALCETRWARHVARITPEFYTHSVGEFNVSASVHKGYLPQFQDRVFFTLLHDLGGRQMSPLPKQDITDHVSGNRFFIRAKVDPTQYWFVPHGQGGQGQQKVFLSRTDRTLFRVDIANAGTSHGREIVMIVRDEITITALVDGKDAPVSVGHTERDDSNLVVGRTHDHFKFADFQGGFRATTSVTVSSMGEQLRGLGKAIHGEGWELVN